MAEDAHLEPAQRLFPRVQNHYFENDKADSDAQERDKGIAGKWMRFSGIIVDIINKCIVFLLSLCSQCDCPGTGETCILLLFLII